MSDAAIRQWQDESARVAGSGAPAAGLGHFPAVDGLRTVAILSVLLFHLRPDYLPGGFVGVDVFFVISGFVVTASMIDRRFERLGDMLAYFYRRRVLRILPALLVVLIVTTIVSLLFIPFASGMVAMREVGLPAFFGASNVALAIIGRGYFERAAEFNPFLHTWTLGVEEQFYLLFPFLLYFWQRGGTVGKRMTVAVVAVASLLSLAACAWLMGRDQRLAFYLMPARFWELGAGMLLCLTIDYWRPRLERLGATQFGLAAILCAVILAASFVQLVARPFPFPAALAPVAATFGLIALVCASPHSAAGRLLSLSPVVYVGRISYSLYLWHWPVFVFARWTVGLEHWIWMTAATTLSFLLAILSYHGVEQPARLSAKLRSARPWPVVALGAFAATACAGVAAMLISAEYRLSLSPAVRAQNPRSFDAGGGCALAETEREISHGTVRSYIPNCRDRAGAGRLIVAGDSHAQSYEPILRRYASDSGVPVTGYYALGCEFPALSAPPRGGPGCAAFERTVAAELLRTLRRGDVLFLASLRVPVPGAVVQTSSYSGAELAAAYARTRALVGQFAATGATVIVDAPKPVFLTDVMRCSEWYNRHHPDCRGGFTMPRAQALAHRSATMSRLLRLRAEIPGILLWDPFPLLCPRDPCSAFDGETPLYIDNNHVGVFGSRRLYPAFRRLIDRARSAPVASRRQTQ